jgi:acyl-CoA synthetase (AMP-forming)/AMP-acid ligase II
LYVTDQKYHCNPNRCLNCKPGASITEAELITWWRENMAAYKYPRIVEFRETLPMTATGKILKRELVAVERAQVCE